MHQSKNIVESHNYGMPCAEGLQKLREDIRKWSRFSVGFLVWVCKLSALQTGNVKILDCFTQVLVS